MDVFLFLVWFFSHYFCRYRKLRSTNKVCTIIDIIKKHKSIINEKKKKKHNSNNINLILFVLNVQCLQKVETDGKITLDLCCIDCGFKTS